MNVLMSSLEEKLELEDKLPEASCIPAVSFTMETEKDGMLPFLGTQLLNRTPKIVVCYTAVFRFVTQCSSREERCVTTLKMAV